MRCIEMSQAKAKKGSWITININMRCIEIKKVADMVDSQLRLTLTWDVLKLFLYNVS